MKQIAVCMVFLISSVMAEEGKKTSPVRTLWDVGDDSGVESRLGGADLQLDFFRSEAGPPPSGVCSATYSNNVDVEWLANREIGLFKGQDIQGNTFLECPILTFDASFAHLNCPGVGLIGSDIDPEDPTLEHDPSSRTIFLSQLEALGPTVPAGNYSFEFNQGVDFTDHNPVHLKLNFDFQQTEKVLQAPPLAPFIAAGEFGDFTISSRLQVSNTGRWPLRAEYDFFGGGANGGPADVRIGNVIGNSFEWEVGPGGTRSWEIEPPQEGGVVIVFGQVRPIDQSVQELVVATEYFTTSSSQSPQGQKGTLIGQAGLESSRLGTMHSLSVRKNVAGVNTGIVLLNPTGVDADLTLHLFDANETQVSQAQMQLLGRTLVSKFALEYFDLEQMESFDGTAIVLSNVDITSLSLRTLDGIQQSSLPSGVAGIP